MRNYLRSASTCAIALVLALVHKCASARVRKYMRKYANVQIRKCANAQVRKYASASVQVLALIRKCASTSTCASVWVCKYASVQVFKCESERLIFFQIPQYKIKITMNSCNSSKHETSIQCCFNVGPASKTVVQHSVNRETSQCVYRGPSALCIIFGRVVSGVPWFHCSTVVLMQLWHQCWRWCRLW